MAAFFIAFWHKWSLVSVMPNNVFGRLQVIPQLSHLRIRKRPVERLPLFILIQRCSTLNSHKINIFDVW